MDRGAWLAIVYRVKKALDTTEQLTFSQLCTGFQKSHFLNQGVQKSEVKELTSISMAAKHCWGLLCTPLPGLYFGFQLLLRFGISFSFTLPEVGSLQIYRSSNILVFTGSVFGAIWISIFILLFTLKIFNWLHLGLVAVCGISFPDQRLNLGPLHWECRVLATEPPGKSLSISTQQFGGRWR